MKLGIYANWYQVSSKIDPASTQIEFYDYSTTRGQLELDNTPDDARPSHARPASWRYHPQRTAKACTGPVRHVAGRRQSRSPHFTQPHRKSSAVLPPGGESE